MRLRPFIFCYFLLAAGGVFSACQEERHKEDFTFPSGTQPEEDIPVWEKAGWQLVADKGDLPEYVKVYKSPERLQGKEAVAYIAVAEIGKVTFEILGNVSGNKTPSEFYASAARKPAVIMNAGYFWDGNTVSVLCRDGDILAASQPVWQASETYYPTRGAFGKGKDGDYAVNWIYTVGNNIYAYPLPASNREGEAPLPEPSAEFPEGSWVWSADQVVGGGPVLVKNGKICNTWKEELFGDASGIGALSNNPRTALGIIPQKQLIFFVCEGRNITPGVPGYTLNEVAEILSGLGCTDVVNLDGGGSSCMLVNGQETIKPSSQGVQRAVVTAVALW